MWPLGREEKRIISVHVAVKNKILSCLRFRIASVSWFKTATS